MRSGFSLLELCVVLVILVVIAAVVVPLVSSAPDDARRDVTRDTMVKVRDLILGPYRADMKSDVLEQFAEANPGTPFTSFIVPRQHFTGAASELDLRYLYLNPGLDVPRDRNQDDNRDFPMSSYNPQCRRGWNGPYFPITGPDYTVRDGWGNVIVLRESTTLVQNVVKPCVELVSGGADADINTTNDNVIVVIETKP